MLRSVNRFVAKSSIHKKREELQILLSGTRLFQLEKNVRGLKFEFNWALTLPTVT